MSFILTFIITVIFSHFSVLYPWTMYPLSFLTAVTENSQNELVDKDGPTFQLCNHYYLLHRMDFSNQTITNNILS